MNSASYFNIAMADKQAVLNQICIDLSTLGNLNNIRYEPSTKPNVQPKDFKWTYSALNIGHISEKAITDAYVNYVETQIKPDVNLYLQLKLHICSRIMNEDKFRVQPDAKFFCQVAESEMTTFRRFISMFLLFLLS